MESIVCPECDKVVHYKYYFQSYRCSCGWSYYPKMKRSRRVFVAKKVWEDFLDGRGKILETLEAGELHYRFGDCPEKYVVEVEMSEVLPVPDIEKGAPFEP